MKHHAWILALFVIGCGESSAPGIDASSEIDASSIDAAVLDGSTPLDASDPVDARDPLDAVSPLDAQVLADGGPDLCAAMDVRMARPCGPTERPGPRWLWNGNACEVVYWCECAGDDCGALFADERACNAAYGACGDACTSDAQCASGSEWCEGGRCVECDNSGLVCFLACDDGWSTYQRNGCSPCECAPPSACDSNDDCAAGHCYAGTFCWEGCAAGDPACCRGNQCGAPGCTTPSPAGCRTSGCPRGQRCDTMMGCESSSCACGGGDWACTDDCGGGVCVPE